MMNLSWAVIYEHQLTTLASISFDYKTGHT